MKRVNKLVDNWNQELYWYDYIPLVGIYTMRNVPSTLRLNDNQFMAYVFIQSTWSVYIIGALITLFLR